MNLQAAGLLFMDAMNSSRSTVRLHVSDLGGQKFSSRSRNDFIFLVIEFGNMNQASSASQSA